MENLNMDCNFFNFIFKENTKLERLATTFETTHLKAKLLT